MATRVKLDEMANIRVVLKFSSSPTRMSGTPSKQP